MKNSRETIQKRQGQILDFLRNNPYATAEQIAEAMRVSPATIRRDIRSLKQSGDIQKQYGISKLSEPLKILPNFDDERFALANVDEKEAIAKKAAAFIEDGDTVFLNSSSTALRMLPYIKEKHVILVTNNGRSLSVKRNPGTELILTGGEIAAPRHEGSIKMSMTGEIAVQSISRITANKCFLGVSGISVHGGLTSMAIQEPAVNRMMMQQCSGPVFILADHRKIGVKHNFYFAKISEITCLITDSNSSRNALADLQNRGVDIIFAE